MSQIKSSPVLVTIFSTVYNNGRETLTALNSIKRQLYSPIQHIIVDDCSTDDSVEIIQKWIDENNHDCFFVKHTKNVGLCASINHAVRLAKGKYITALSDDNMMPDKLVEDVMLLEANPSFAFVHSRAILRYTETNEDIPLYYEKSGTADLFAGVLAGRINICTPTITYRTAVFDDVGLFDETLSFEDTDMFLRILSKYPVGYIKKFTVFYYRHKVNFSRTKTKLISQEIFTILSKWKHIPNYRLYKVYRHQSAFYHFASYEKRYAMRHLPMAMLAFWRRELYSGIYHLFFKWKKQSQ